MKILRVATVLCAGLLAVVAWVYWKSATRDYLTVVDGRRVGVSAGYLVTKRLENWRSRWGTADAPNFPGWGTGQAEWGSDASGYYWAAIPLFDVGLGLVGAMFLLSLPGLSRVMSGRCGGCGFNLFETDACRCPSCGGWNVLGWVTKRWTRRPAGWVRCGRGWRRAWWWGWFGWCRWRWGWSGRNTDAAQ